MQKPRMLAILSVSLIGILVLVSCSTPVSKTYYRNHPRTARDVTEAWGEPVSVVMLPNGIEKRIYTIQDPYTDLKYRYFLVEDGKIVASGLTDGVESNLSSGSDNSVAFVPNDISKVFYDHFRTTVADLDRTWGDPLLVKQTSGGIQYRIYEIQDPYTDFKYRKFIVKNGVVQASRISMSKGFDKDDQGKPLRGMEVVELSRDYYVQHPMSQEAVDRIWGPPVAVEAMPAGRQKRIYRVRMPIDIAFSYRFFIIDDGMVVASGISDMVDATGP